MVLNKTAVQLVISLFIFAFSFSYPASAGSLEEAEKVVRDEFRLAQPGAVQDETTNSRLRETLNAVRENYARAQAEQQANAARADRAYAINAATNQTQLIQTAWNIEQMRQNQLQQLAALETNYKNIASATRSIQQYYLSTVPQLTPSYSSSYYNDTGYSFLTGLFTQAVVNGVVNLVKQYQIENQRQEQLKEQLQILEEAERRQQQVIEEEKKQLQTSMTATAGLINQLKQLADKIPPKDEASSNLFQNLFGITNPATDYSPQIAEYKRLIESRKDLLGDMKFPDLNDTFEDRVLAWDGVITSYNAVVNQFNQKYPGLVKPFGEQGFFSDREIGALAFLTNANLSKLSDSQLVSAFHGDQSRISEATLKVAREECKFRKIECTKGNSEFWKIVMPIGQSSFVGSTSQIDIGSPAKTKKVQLTEEDLKTMDQKSLEKWARSELKILEADRKQLQKTIQSTLESGRADVYGYEDRVEELTAKERSIYQTFKGITGREFPHRG